MIMMSVMIVTSIVIMIDDYDECYDCDEYCDNDDKYSVILMSRSLCGKFIKYSEIVMKLSLSPYKNNLQPRQRNEHYFFIKMICDRQNYSL
jgi:hypothetical protein